VVTAIVFHQNSILHNFGQNRFLRESCFVVIFCFHKHSLLHLLYYSSVVDMPRINLTLAARCRKCAVTDPNVSSKKSGLKSTLLTATAVRLFRRYEMQIFFDTLQCTMTSNTVTNFRRLLSNKGGHRRQWHSVKSRI
jgi:hypothetical protein